MFAQNWSLAGQSLEVERCLELVLLGFRSERPCCLIKDYAAAALTCRVHSSPHYMARRDTDRSERPAGDDLGAPALTCTEHRQGGTSAHWRK
ncbi:hypothetical protein JYU34_005980 [Plutella xylostella]|uniref:Uncharacterized protein n=1 Tax=Plutella xylostella TaxID=51655 RepID=A0ABQ7QUM9_PLUXY|nr:hypothetical protein JYU34_005980 [Plutella xylostella]